MNEESLEPITARLGVDIAEEMCAGFVGFFFPLPFIFCTALRGMMFSFLSAWCRHITDTLGWCFGSSSGRRVGCQLLEETYNPLTCAWGQEKVLVWSPGWAAAMAAAGSSLDGRVCISNHTKSAENYLAGLIWPNNVSVCVARHFLFIAFPPVQLQNMQWFRGQHIEDWVSGKKKKKKKGCLWNRGITEC